MHREAWQDTLSDLVTTIKGDQSVKKLTSDVANTQASILIDTVDHPFPFTEPTTSSYKSTASLRRARSFKNTPRGSYTETVKLKHDQSKRMLAHTAKAMQALGIDYSSNALSKGVTEKPKAKKKRNYHMDEEAMKHLRVKLRKSVAELRGVCECHLRGIELLNEQIIQQETQVDTAASMKGLIKIGVDRPRYERAKLDSDDKITNQELMLNLRIQNKKLKGQRRQFQKEINILKKQMNIRDESGLDFPGSLRNEVNMIRKKVLEERTKFAQLNDINGARIKELRLIRNELDDDLQRQRHINESVMADLEQYSDRRTALVAKIRVLKARLVARQDHSG